MRQVFETAFFYHIRSPVGKEIRVQVRNIIQWSRMMAPGTRSEMRDRGKFKQPPDPQGKGGGFLRSDFGWITPLYD